MKNWRSFGVLVLTVCTIFVSKIHAGLSSNTEWDTEADKQIMAIVELTHYVNQEMSYSYAGKEWNIRLIHSPLKDKLVCGSASFICPFYLLTNEVMPYKLFEHLKEITEKFLEPAYAGIFNISGRCSFGRVFIEAERFFSNGGRFNNSTACEFFANPDFVASPLEIMPPEEMPSSDPMAVAYKVEDPSIDKQIQEMWDSETFDTRVFHYQLEGRLYKVRIIYNPDYLSHQATQQFNVNGEGKSFHACWDSKYGILVDKRAPQELIDHLSSLVPTLSWCDWFFGQLKIHNGAKFKINIQGREYNTISWFHFLGDM